MPDAFIIATGAFLPGAPVDNDRIEQVLGELPTGRSRLKRRILQNNGIVSRHYALDPETRQPTHTSAQLGAESIRVAVDRAGLALDEIELLACGSSIPELITPGHASMVHGELGGHPCEIVSTHGVCCAGMTALKYAAMAVKTGDVRTAVAGAAERTSSHLRASHFTAELAARAVDERDPYVGFDQEFLRWMLSDGAGAAVLRDRPAPSGLSLRVEWVELFSFAHALPACMYMGAERVPGGGLRSWRDMDSLDDALKGGHFNLHQDTKLLGQHMVDVCVRQTLPLLRKKRRISPDDVDWLLPHYSSEFFRDKSHDALVAADFPIPLDKWRSNLATRGNTGSASIYIMLDEFLAGGELREGDGVLLMVPESGRFSSAWAFLRAVSAG